MKSKNYGTVTVKNLSNYFIFFFLCSLLIWYAVDNSIVIAPVNKGELTLKCLKAAAWSTATSPVESITATPYYRCRKQKDDAEYHAIIIIILLVESTYILSYSMLLFSSFPIILLTCAKL